MNLFSTCNVEMPKHKTAKEIRKNDVINDLFLTEKFSKKLFIL